MEKVFAMDSGDKFDVARLGSPTESAGSDRDRDRGPPPRYGDRDFNRKSYLALFLRLIARIENGKVTLLLCRTSEKELSSSAHAPEESAFEVYAATFFTVSYLRRRWMEFYRIHFDMSSNILSAWKRKPLSRERCVSFLYHGFVSRIDDRFRCCMSRYAGNSVFE